MITLAFDSTAKAASVAVCDGKQPLGVYTIDNGLTQSELLLPMAENLLHSLKMSFSDVKLIAVAVGPGSFTGVRIGVALAKGIAFAKDIPCVAVSTLEALCENISPLPGILVPCMDARRNQVYSAIFKSDGNDVTRITEDRAISIDELARELKEYGNESIYLCGDGYEVAKAGLLKNGVSTMNTPPLLITENAYSVATVANRKYAAGEYTDDTALLPTYLRLPQAERERLEREAQRKKEKENE